MKMKEPSRQIIIIAASVIGVVFVLTLILFGSDYRKVSIIAVLGIVGCIVGFAGFYEYSFLPPLGTLYRINLHNPVFDSVAVVLPDGSSITLNKGVSIYDIQIYASQTIQAVGTISTNQISVPYTHISIFNTDVYYVPGGAITADNYIPFFNIINHSASTVNIYSKTTNGTVIQLASVDSQDTVEYYAFVGQSFSINTTFTGAQSVLNASQKQLVVNPDGTLSVS